MSVWRLQITPITGATPYFLDADDAIESLPSFSVDTQGGGLEATFTGVGGELGIRPLDGVRFYTRATPASAWVMRYAGRVMLAPSPHETSLGAYRMIGTKELAYVKTVTAPMIPGGDVGLMARALADGTPGGPLYRAWDIPALDLQLGDRFPQYESLGEALDALAETCGAFIVPSGGSYAYDGTAYSTGARVPPVQWGLRNLTSGLYFRRPPPNTVSLDESEPGVRVEWEAVSGADTIAFVRLVYASQFAGDDLIMPPMSITSVSQTVLAPFAQPLNQVHQSATSAITRERVVAVEGPRDFMTEAPTTVLPFNITNPGFATDGNPDTYAEVSNPPGGEGDLVISASITPAQRGCLLYVDFDVGDTNLFGRNHALWITTHLGEYLEPFKAQVRMRYGFAADAARPRFRRVIPVLLPADAPTGTVYNSVRVSVYMQLGCRVYDARVYVPHPASGNNPARTLAASFMREPVSDAASVERIGAHPPVSNVHLTPVTGSPVTLPVERIEYSVTRERGVVTRYHIGQAFDGELESERAVLEALAIAQADREARKREARSYEPRRVN